MDAVNVLAEDAKQVQVNSRVADREHWLASQAPPSMRNKGRRGKQVQSSYWCLGKIRWLALDHLNRHDAQTPDVDFAPIFLSSHNFRGHPVWRSHHGCSFVVRVINLCAKAKIREFDVSFFRKKNVVGLDVTVYHIL